ncbi:peroxisome targeting signal 1 receptor [Perkinsela sp. CCAP 1560/4]|nr:peroxisome targeting signal 1 receptor [Perkinsela sp. CCAP 1560/4]|eukprot:KNH04276.1 peroxisome targeting signal 1 receptor [Perkinsela sp. CCAP 1560/4]
MTDADCGQQLVQSTLSNVFGGSVFKSIISNRNTNLLPSASTHGNAMIDDYQKYNEPIQPQQEASFLSQNNAPIILEQQTVENSQNSAISSSFFYPPPIFGAAFPGAYNTIGQHAQVQPSLHEYINQSGSSINLVEDSKWLDSLSSAQQDATNFSEAEVRNFVGEGDTQRTYEERRAESQFYKFLHDYKTGVISSEDTTATQEREHEVEQTIQPTEREDSNWMEDNANPQVREFNTLNPNGFDETWSQAYQQSSEKWAEEYLTDQVIDEVNKGTVAYPFMEENPYLYHHDPFAEGQSLLQSGAIAAAALAFEAECQKDSPHPEAWYMLGTVQQENEKDVLAILALQKAIEDKSANTQAHLAMAASQTNEYMYSEALHSLDNWMSHNPLCQDAGFISGDFDSLETALERVLTTHPREIDVHVALGTFYNIKHAYEKAIEAFRNALSVNPNSSALWNKLGASLANSGDPASAMDAYRTSLGITPTSHRCMYNLAVGLMNSGQNAEAIHQLARLLQGQENDTTNGIIKDARRKSNDVWNLVRINAEQLGRDEIVRLVDDENVEALCRSLGIE